MAVAFLSGILLAVYGVSHVLMAAAMFAAVPVVTGILLRHRRAGDSPPDRMTGWHGISWRVCLRILLLVAFLFLGFGRYSAQQEFRGAYLPYLSDGMRLSVQGRLSGKEIKYHQYVYELTSCVIGLDHPVPCNRILVYSDSDIASIGEILVFDGTVSLWKDAVNEGNFDAEAFYLARKTDFQVKDITLRGVYGKAVFWRECLWQLRLALKDVYQKVLSSEECGVLTTMVLGDKELLDEETRHLYQVGGLSHIMAISGLHVSVVGMTLYGFFKKRGVGFVAAGIFAGAGVFAFGTMAGMGTSVQRAVLMFFLLLIGQALGRSYDTLNALGAAALFLLWNNPYLPWDAGFRFSFAAVLGVAWVGRGVSVKEGRFSKLLERMLPGAAIQLTTLPLAAWHYFELPVYAMAVNLVVLPFTGILLALGIAGGFVGLWWEPLAWVLLFPCQKLLELNRFLCEICEGLPGSLWVTGRPTLMRVVVYYALLAAVVLYVHSLRRKDDQKTQGRPCVQRTGRVFVCAAALLLFLLCVPQKREFALVVLDVGQGDGSFLRTGEGYTLFVDGGSSDVRQVGRYRIMPFLKYQGARRIDFWIVSHADEDHICGLREILAAGYPVRYLIFSKAVVQDEAFAELLVLAEEAGTRVLYLNAGETLHLGNAELTALFPAAGAVTGSDRNAASLVVWYEEDGFSGIFTGDIASAQEAMILEQWRQNGELPGNPDFYKAAHHGSGYSNSEDFLQTLSPAVSVVSCGVNNRYGHPGEEAVAHMEQAGSEVYYTMESGQITVTMEHGEAAVHEYHPSLEWE